MENNEKKTFGAPGDWILILGGVVSVIGLMRLLSGVLGVAAGWTAPDAPASIGGSGNTTISVAIFAGGLVIVGIASAIRRRE